MSLDFFVGYPLMEWTLEDKLAILRERDRYKKALETIDDDPPIGLDWSWHRQIAREALSA